MFNNLAASDLLPPQEADNMSIVSIEKYLFIMIRQLKNIEQIDSVSPNGNGSEQSQELGPFQLPIDDH